ncbi:NADAR family protein [Entamoeba marina]
MSTGSNYTKVPHYSIKWLKEHVTKQNPLDAVFFWKTNEPKTGCFSQWWKSDFTVDGITYHFAEQFMMAEKARLFKDDEVKQMILEATDPKTIKDLGRQIRNFDSKIWDENKSEIVFNGNVAKFHQDEELLKILLGTGDKVIVEASPMDKIWGIKMAANNKDILNVHKWKGENLLGFALMSARDFLKD